MLETTTDPGMLANFHFLRPWWLLSLIPATLLSWLLWRQRVSAGQWRNIIQSELLPFLLDQQDQQTRHKYYIWALVFWVLASLALAGPSWSRLPLPVHKQEAALVILLDLSPSMLAEDQKPNRLTRARLKLTDLLHQRREGTSALIAYAGEAHLVSPLTDDTATIISLIPSLHPNIMPAPGSQPLGAVELGMELILQAGHQGGDLLLVSDGITDGDRQAISALLQSMGGFRLSTLALGSEEGAPIPAAGGGFVKNRAGNIVVARTDNATFRALASENGGRHARLSHDEKDIEHLLGQWDNLPNRDTHQLDRSFDTWLDQGHWLLILALPLAALAFRRNLIVVWLIAPALLASPDSQALEWADLWQRPDQQGQKAFNAGDMETAMAKFRDSRWRGAAAYRQGEYEQAISAFSQSENPDSQYNLANSLARSGELQEALDAYEQLLSQQPDHDDAAFNRDLVKQMLEQARQNADQNQHQQDHGSDDKGGDSQENPDQQSADEDEPSDSENSQNNRAQNQDGEQPDSKPGDQSEQQEQLKNAEQDSGKEEGQDQQTPPAQTQAGQLAELPDEQRQAMEQWLRRVPDDPGGLLRRKFQYQSRMRGYERQEANENDGEQRW